MVVCVTKSATLLLKGYLSPIRPVLVRTCNMSLTDIISVQYQGVQVGVNLNVFNYFRLLRQKLVNTVAGLRRVIKNRD